MRFPVDTSNTTGKVADAPLLASRLAPSFSVQSKAFGSYQFPKQKKGKVTIEATIIESLLPLVTPNCRTVMRIDRAARTSCPQVHHLPILLGRLPAVKVIS